MLQVTGYDFAVQTLSPLTIAIRGVDWRVGIDFMQFIDDGLSAPADEPVVNNSDFQGFR